MPVFHTKTIEDILEPVAQQVSKLVLLYEEAEDGYTLPDLTIQITAVKDAVDNLVTVGHQTIASSTDEMLRHDLPATLHRVEEAVYYLLDANTVLKHEPHSATARHKLIEGSRGILQGTSALLLTLDESEVRKIITACARVLEYMSITEVLDTMDDLVTFVKNLAPVLSRMTQEVDLRARELTHEKHADALRSSLANIKALTPPLIVSIQDLLTSEGNERREHAVANRTANVSKLTEEVEEIVRVLRLTTHDQDEWTAEDLALVKRALVAIQLKKQKELNWRVEAASGPAASGALGGTSAHNSIGAPPRPPLPEDLSEAPPRPPPPEDEEDAFAGVTGSSTPQPIMTAAYNLHVNMGEWESRDNEIVAAAKRMAVLMAKLSQILRSSDTAGTANIREAKRELIRITKEIVNESNVVVRLAKQLANECTDDRMKLDLLQVCERIPTIGTQLSVLSTVKALMFGAKDVEEDVEATESLIGNAENLMFAVGETVKCSAAASIKIRVDSGYRVRWVRKQAWYMSG